MKLREYFEDKKGIGVLSTVNGYGIVNSAVYARPHFVEDNVLAFIMRNKRSLHNLQSNPYASYLFREDGSGYKGKRINMIKINEEQDAAAIEALSRRTKGSTEKNTLGHGRSLVYFRIQEVRPLVGESW